MIAKFSNKSKQMKATVPEAFLCPLTKEIMIDPYVNRHGVTYERAAIVDHITHQMKPFCPITKKSLSVRDIIPNYKLRIEIIKYRREVLGEDSTTTTTNYINDDNAIREVEFVRAMTYTFSPPSTCSKKRLTTGRRNDIKNMLRRFSPGGSTN